VFELRPISLHASDLPRVFPFIFLIFQGSLLFPQDSVSACFAHTQYVALVVHYHVFEYFDGVTDIAFIAHFILQFSYEGLFHGNIVLVIVQNALLTKQVFQTLKGISIHFLFFFMHILQARDRIEKKTASCKKKVFIIGGLATIF